ncbi:ATP-binding protein [Pseudomaricurvus alcaniphilus]|uniref:ATP-binding protein n=1 Tax=Pseudomaricurvus alcaniphilus TaxID=1166482 RepID=UPI001409789A|nr:ATP-binding protein [Pseudomaricurvus alcaniphilus]NHN35743.1 ATP-binding protein [Pseudomaricurvus alcaniphilus]
MYPRYSEHNVKEALSDTPVVFIMGPRQVGKTTLVKTLITETGADNWTFITLDDQAQFEIARADPVGFIRNLPSTRIALDEVQRLPELFISIKQAVDEQRTPGRFLLTGSANALLLPRLSDSLAGRMESVRLMTLSECEIHGRQPDFLTKLLDQKAPTTQNIRVREHLLHRLVSGCFPEPLQRASERRSQAWYQQYLNTLIQRDIRDLTHIDHPDLMAKLLKLTAFYAGKLVNLTELGGKLGLDRLTIKKYMALLEQLFLVEQLPAWHCNEYKRLVKTPKLHSVDTGMMCAMRGLNRERLLKQAGDFGSVLESFVYNELRKQAVWIEEPLNFYHYRDKDKVEVDVIIENAMGDCFAIEVKAAASLSAKDFSGLKRFQGVAGDRFKIGVLLYDGDHTTAFGDNLYAVPLGALWS